MRNKAFYIAFVFSFVALTLVSQTDSSNTKLQIEGFVDTYYGYDFNKPGNGTRPSFLYNHTRHNEVNVNLALITLRYPGAKTRGCLSLMAGTYAQYNLAAEPSLIKNIYEAHAGIKLKKNIWLDAGIFPSHIGFESAISKDCWTLTRSLCAENSPYYESGARLSWNPSEKWQINLLFLNGWQRIQRSYGNSTPAFGTQISWKPNTKLNFNYSTFIGNDKPDSISQTRFFNNFYAILQLNDLVGLTTGFDIGFEQTKHGSSNYNNWYTPVIIAKFNLSKTLSIAARAEYYEDKNGVIVFSPTTNGFVVKGYSLNIDYKPSRNILCRLESKLYDSKDRFFEVNNKLSTQNLFLCASIAFSFQ